MPKIVDLIDEVITNFENEETLKDVAKKVNSLMEGKPLFKMQHSLKLKKNKNLRIIYFEGFYSFALEYVYLYKLNTL